MSWDDYVPYGCPEYADAVNEADYSTGHSRRKAFMPNHHFYHNTFFAFFDESAKQIHRTEKAILVEDKWGKSWIPISLCRWGLLSERKGLPNKIWTGYCRKIIKEDKDATRF